MAEDLILRLFEHLWWADEAASRTLTAGESAGDAIDLYAHVVATELVWLDRIEGRTQSVAVWPETTLEGSLRLAAESRRRYEMFLPALDERRAELVSYVNSAGRTFSNRVDDILLHVALHGAYHRGQIAAAVRRLGGRPEPSDYIAFVRGAPAATRGDAT